MALTPKIITDHTPLAAAAMVGALALSIFAFVELAPRHDLERAAESYTFIEELPPRESNAPPAVPKTPFSPNALPADPTACATIADDVLDRFAPVTAGIDVERNTAQIAELVDQYIDANCPAAIHTGEWDAAAQILSVGLVFDVLRHQAEIYGTHVWNNRSDALTPVATKTFDVLAPQTMCEQALRQQALEDGESNEFTPLMDRCVRAFDDLLEINGATHAP